MTSFALPIVHRHAELVSPCGDFVPASIVLHEPKLSAEKWTLNQVQGDEVI